jgi:hypothetical protein
MYLLMMVNGLDSFITYLSNIQIPFVIHFLRHIIDELTNQRLGLFPLFSHKMNIFES